MEALEAEAEAEARLPLAPAEFLAGRAPVGGDALPFGLHGLALILVALAKALPPMIFRNSSLIQMPPPLPPAPEREKNARNAQGERGGRRTWRRLRGGRSQPTRSSG